MASYQSVVYDNVSLGCQRPFTIYLKAIFNKKKQSSATYRSTSYQPVALPLKLGGEVDYIGIWGVMMCTSCGLLTLWKLQIKHFGLVHTHAYGYFFYMFWPFVHTQTAFSFWKLLPGWRFSETPFSVLMCRHGETDKMERSIHRCPLLLCVMSMCLKQQEQQWQTTGSFMFG